MTTVAVLRGGMGDEHAVSLKTGSAFLQNLPEAYQGVDVFIDRGGTWHVRGVPISPERSLAGADVAINALHGAYGEDGTVQHILERSGIPYTGAGAYASGASLNKVLAKEVLGRQGVKLPRHVILKVSPDLERDAIEAFRKFSPPVVVKPIASGSSVGVALGRTFAEFWDALKEAFSRSREVMVEEYIVGKEATVGVIEDFRGQSQYALLPVEVLRPPYSIFGFDQKLSPAAMLRTPASFSRDESAQLEQLALLAHRALSLRHYSRSDFIVSPHGIYFLEANALPGLADDSAFGKSLQAVGVSIKDFTGHLLSLPLSHA